MEIANYSKCGQWLSNKCACILQVQLAMYEQKLHASIMTRWPTTKSGT